MGRDRTLGTRVRTTQGSEGAVSVPHPLAPQGIAQPACGTVRFPPWDHRPTYVAPLNAVTRRRAIAAPVPSGIRGGCRATRPRASPKMTLEERSLPDPVQTGVSKKGTSARPPLPNGHGWGVSGGASKKEIGG